MNTYRCLRLARQAVDTLGLDLSGLIVLTEAATGYYALTAPIAALGGAGHVYALTRDSRYGSAAIAQEQTLAVASNWQLDDHITVLFSRGDERIGLADIVTNLGFVRPLGPSFLSRLKPTAVIPLMWETWEYRPEDLDLDACRHLGIPVLGTDEHHPDLQIFRYLSTLAFKLLLELQIELVRSRIVVIGGGEFGAYIAKGLQAAGAEVTQVYVSEGESMGESRVHQALARCDAIVVAEHHNREMLIGSEGQLSATKLRQLNPGICVAHIAGGVERLALEAEGIRCNPNSFAPAGYMSVAADYIGPRPLIDLHTAGLVVGQHMARARLDGALCEEARALSLVQCPLAQGFQTQGIAGGKT